MPTRFLRAALAALSAAAALAPVTVAAFDKVDPPVQVTAGESRLYYIGEQSAAHQPIAGRQVTMSVLSAPGPGASVTASDASQHSLGAAGPQASTASGVDGKAYFILQTSGTPGENDFTWSDGTFTGKVTLVGVGAAAPTPSPSAATHPTPAPTRTAAPTVTPTPAGALAVAGTGPTEGGDGGRLLVAALVGLGTATLAVRIVPVRRLGPVPGGPDALVTRAGAGSAPR